MLQMLTILDASLVAVECGKCEESNENKCRNAVAPLRDEETKRCENSGDGEPALLAAGNERDESAEDKPENAEPEQCAWHRQQLNNEPATNRMLARNARAGRAHKLPFKDDARKRLTTPSSATAERGAARAQPWHERQMPKCS